MMEETYCVYKHTCPNGKVYIGITSNDPKRRWNNGNGYRQNNHFSNAIKKYGWKNIKHEIVLSDITKEQAAEKEIELIKESKSWDPKYGYNNTLGGEGGQHFTEDAKARISKSLKDRYSSDPELRKKSSLSKIGRRASEETKAKMSESQKRRWTDDDKKRLSERMRGNRYRVGKSVVFSDETREKISKSKKGIATSFHGRTPRPVKCVDTGEVFDSAVAASRIIGKSFTPIYRCCNGERKTAHGFKWQYVTEL